ncbi:MAG TPA: metalloregulator ArsR/SmtB family transcription factor [Patescibacteria group bacterium]|nr:metalloregulator ArsR/SmtB family transcription factor [Patescibacteria group bacterium]
MNVDQLSTVFGALADPTRRAILARLADGDLAVRDLAAPFPMSQPAISRHLKVLEGAGLISRSRRATVRLSHLEAAPLRDATSWLARYQAYWEERYDQLDELLARLQREATATPAQQPTPSKAPKSKKRKKQRGRNRS